MREHMCSVQTAHTHARLRASWATGRQAGWDDGAWNEGDRRDRGSARTRGPVTGMGDDPVLHSHQAREVQPQTDICVRPPPDPDRGNRGVGDRQPRTDSYRST